MSPSSHARGPAPLKARGAWGSGLSCYVALTPAPGGKAGVHLDLEAGGGLGPGLEPGGCQFSIFSAFQVSHEFAINFNPTNPFCSGECQAHLHLPWFLHLAISVGGGRAEDRFLSPSSLPFHSRLLRVTDEERARACSRAVLDSRPAAALSWLCDLGETTASLGAEPLPPHLPQGGVIPTWLASLWSGEI